MLQKCVYSYEYMDSWQRFNQNSIPDKKECNSNMTMENITDSDFKSAKNVRKDIGIKDLGKHHNLYVQSDTPLFGDVFKNFPSKCMEIYELDPAYFLLAPRLA